LRVARRRHRAQAVRRDLHGFCDALRDKLGRAPVVADVTADAIAAYSRDLEQRGPQDHRVDQRHDLRPALRAPA
jgi:hypothetical protein